MSYLNSVSLVGFVGSDPEQRQGRNNGAKFTVLSLATQRSWKNVEDEWVSKTEWHRIAVFGHVSPNTFSTTSRRATTYDELIINTHLS
jgi:single-strand DNA-binding protein